MTANDIGTIHFLAIGQHSDAIFDRRAIGFLRVTKNSAFTLSYPGYNSQHYM